MNIDPLASKYFSYSPYQNAMNNPVYFIDIDGMRVWSTEDPKVDKIYNAGELDEIVINSIQTRSSGTTNLSWLSNLVPDVSLGHAFFGKDLYKSYDKVFADENGRAFYKDLHKHDKQEVKIYTEGLVMVAAPGVLKLLIELGSLALAAESATVIGGARQEAIVAVIEGEEAIVVSEARQSLVQANRTAGNAFRDELADLLRKDGFEVATEVYKKTPFGKRFIDIEMSKAGEVLGGIETKVGGSRYLSSQRIKDFYLSAVKDYTVTLIRRPPGW
jgi:hypothetical protein